MLLEALQRHPGLCGSGGPWALADSLLALFDELERHDISMEDDAEHFGHRLAGAYGLPQPIEPLSREARLVTRLWQAWREQLNEEGVCEAPSSRRERLKASLAHLPEDICFYVVGLDDLAPDEARWLKALLDRGQARLVLQGSPDPAVSVDQCHPAAILRHILETLDAMTSRQAGSQDAYGAFLDTALAPSDVRQDADLARRARAFARQYPDTPARGRLMLYGARDPEEEARAVELQVRRWLLEGVERIGIVSEDRRLARRVRALLERAGVVLQDHGGWALSTTSAASVVERLLQTAEEDYAHEPLLDLLKSPFIFPDLPRDDLLKRVYRLEQDIILHENVGRGLERYRQHLAYRHRRLGWRDDAKEEVMELLDRLEESCEPLRGLAGRGRHSPAALLSALEAAFAASGLDRSLGEDPAGWRVLEEIQALKRAADGRRLRFTWSEFRTWLGRALEGATFVPPRQGEERVQLFTLRQSNLQRFDALIIAAADERQLPGPPPVVPFFNDAVRIELGLVPARRHRALAFHHFRRLLESAPRIMMTFHRQETDEEIQPAPWVAALDACHRLAYGDGLDNDGLGRLLGHPDTQVVTKDAPLPAPAVMPRPCAVPGLLPGEYSAGRYQRLLDCPFLFHAADCLELKAPERIREVLEKSDYGARVHRILERFHDPAAGRDEPLKKGDLETAQRILEEISRNEFRSDLEDNLLHRGWLQRWLRLVPDYLRWQQQRTRQWRVQDVELEARRELAPGLVITGRLDRLDRGDDGRLAVLDYKTGAVPLPAQVEEGEVIQLPFYALLAPASVAEARYLGLDRDTIREGPVLADEALSALSEAVGERLHHLHRRLRSGAPLPAWGDDATCRYCPMAGVCRRQGWVEEEQAS